MQAFKAVINDGKVVLERPWKAPGRFEAVLLVLEPRANAAVIYDPNACPEPVRAAREVLQEFSQRHASTHPHLASAAH